MFDIGFLEIVLIGVVALLVVGPNEFPGLVRNVGRGLGKLRGFLSSVKSDLDFEIDKANEIKQMVEKEAEIARLHEITVRQRLLDRANYQITNPRHLATRLAATGGTAAQYADDHRTLGPGVVRNINH